MKKLSLAALLTLTVLPASAADLYPASFVGIYLLEETIQGRCASEVTGRWEPCRGTDAAEGCAGWLTLSSGDEPSARVLFMQADRVNLGVEATPQRSIMLPGPDTGIQRRQTTLQGNVLMQSFTHHDYYGQGTPRAEQLIMRSLFQATLDGPRLSYTDSFERKDVAGLDRSNSCVYIRR